MSLCLHEYAHAFIAYKNGDETAKRNGRMTLNPLKHLDPVGFLLLAVVGFGYAKPVPVNPYNFRNYKKGYFSVAIAGVTVNLALAIIFSLLLAMMVALGYDLRIVNASIGTMLWSPAAPLSFVRFFGDLFMYAQMINFIFLVFNLLPIYPLDGFRVVETFASNRNKYVTFMKQYGMYVLFGLLIWSFLVNEFLVDNIPIMQYFDPIGLILGTVVDFLSVTFYRLFGLIFGVV